MAGLRRQLGAGRIVRDVALPVHPLPTVQSGVEEAAAVLRILGEGGSSRSLRKASCAARPAGPPRAHSGSDAAIPVAAKLAIAPSAPLRAAGPPATHDRGPAMCRGRIDPHLVRLLDAWATLPARVRDAIMAMIDAARQNRCSTSLPPKV
jgi:hypothetical protein